MNMPEWLYWLAGTVVFVAIVYLWLRSTFHQQWLEENELKLIQTQRYIKFKDSKTMYLVGDFSFRALTNKRVKFKQKITDSDMAKAKVNSDYQIIDLANKTCYDPASDDWIEIPSE